MSQILLFLFLASSLFVPSQTQILEPGNNEEALISIQLSQSGVDFLKSILTSKVLHSITPLVLPKIEQTANIPFLGDVDMLLSNILITQIQVYSSGCNKSRDSAGLQLIAWGEVCNLTINTHLLFYHRIPDTGCAAIQVAGIQLGNRLDLENHNGILKLSLVDLDYNDNDISVELKEGSSLFQRAIPSFERYIGVSLQNAISKKLREQILKLNFILQDVPEEIPTDENSSLKKIASYIFDINGLFISRNSNFRNSQPSVLCTKSIGISIDENGLNSAATRYYNAEFMIWIVDKLPDDTPLNTDIVPELLKIYPNNDMKLNISLSSPPIIRISEHKIDATVNAELIINVLKAEQFVPVACLSLKIESSGSVEIIEDGSSGTLRVGGNIELNDLWVSLKWSKIGNLPLDAIQPAMESLVESVVLPYANARLRQGFVMPGILGFGLWNAEISLSISRITVCGDLTYSELQ